MGYFCAKQFANESDAAAQVTKDGFTWNESTGRYERRRHKATQYAYVVQCKGGRWIITNA